jgi:hypothetical protein
LAKDQVTAYIDHDCVIDKEKYPLYPNQETTLVRLPGTQITDFGNVGYSKTTTHKKAVNGQWKIICVYCLGVMFCDSDGCDHTGPPPTGTRRIKEHLIRYVDLILFVKCNFFNSSLTLILLPPEIHHALVQVGSAKANFPGYPAKGLFFAVTSM